MVNPEQPDAPKPSRGSSGFNKAVRYLSRFLRGAQQPAAPSDALATPPDQPEKANLDIHKEQVAAKMAAFLNMVDERVGNWIGYPANIREELVGRFVSTGRYEHQRRLDTEGMHPALRRHMQHDIFFFRHDDESGAPVAMYKIDCQVGSFLPSIYVATHDGFIEETFFMGPKRDKFYQVKIRRVCNDGRVKHLTTFSPNFFNAYDPPHPLVIEQGGLPIPYFSMIYDNIDPEGNVTLLDGQPVKDPSGRIRGKYSAADHSILATNADRFPYTVEDGQLFLGAPGAQVSFPLKTNLYTELANISQNMRGITPA